MYLFVSSGGGHCGPFCFTQVSIVRVDCPKLYSTGHTSRPWGVERITERELVPGVLLLFGHPGFFQRKPLWLG